MRTVEQNIQRLTARTLRGPGVSCSAVSGRCRIHSGACQSAAHTR